MTPAIRRACPATTGDVRGGDLAAHLTVRSAAIGAASGVAFAIAAFVIAAATGCFAIPDDAIHALAWAFAPVYVAVGCAVFGYAGFVAGNARASTAVLIDSGHTHRLIRCIAEASLLRARGPTVDARSVERALQEAICRDDDLVPETNAERFVADVKARVYRMLRALLARHLVGRRVADLDVPQREALVARVVARVRGRLEESKRRVLLASFLACAMLYVIVPLAFAL